MLERPSGRYTSLSHRWSNSDPLKLTVRNLEQMKADIPFASLSPTFQHAVRVTLELDCQFIWIDSLCIIQDSREDWMHEAALMKEVYANSYLNISATNRRSVEKGLFAQRVPAKDIPIGVEIGPISASDRRRIYMMQRKSYWGDAVADTPLNRRAWVMQERFLAPRVLHFASNELAWECRHHAASETYPDGVPTNLTLTQFKALSFSPGGDGLQSHCRDRLLLDRWDSILAAYTASGISKDQDRLCAFAGVAGYFQALGCGSYMAGLWRDNLLQELLWQIATWSEGRRPNDYCAPSWSWASIRGPVTRERQPSARPDATILDTRVELEDPTFSVGPVLAGEIVLRARAVPVQVVDGQQLVYLASLGGAELDEECIQLDDGSEHLPDDGIFFLPLLLEPGGGDEDCLDGLRGLLAHRCRTAKLQRLGVYFEDDPERLEAVRRVDVQEITII